MTGMENLLKAYVMTVKIAVLVCAIPLCSCDVEDDGPTHAYVTASLSWRDADCGGAKSLTLGVELAPPAIDGMVEATCVVEYGRVDCVRRNGSTSKDMEVVVDFPGWSLTIRTGTCSSEFTLTEVTWET